MSKKFYITTTTPYVNGEPHIGFAKELVFADAIARYQHRIGNDMKFNTGTDEHGKKVYEKALEEGLDPQEYCDKLAPRFEELRDLLHLSFTNFTRTTDEHHKGAAQEFWKRVERNGYIYKKTYKSKYCVGCELEKTDSELEDGKCPIHPNKEIELMDEENYFFKFSAFAEPLLKFYDENPDFVIPDFRFREIKKFVEGGLQDFSISRLKEKMPWGVQVPGDDDHVMYVWFDALVNYISTLGWPEDETGDGFWTDGNQHVQVAGKDNLRQQTAMWQAMLMAADLPLTSHVMILGFITGEGGVKMSKSLGNVISPHDLVEKYGAQAVRYFLLREITSFEDGAFTIDRFKEAYTANLVNGLGNLTSRILKMSETHIPGPIEIEDDNMPDEFRYLMDNFQVQKAADYIWKKIGELDAKIQETEPFKLIKTDPEKAKEIIRELTKELYTVGVMLHPIMPETSMMVKIAVKENTKPEALFPRIED